MAVIHMETEAVHVMSKTLQQSAQSLQSLMKGTLGQTYNVDWYGPSRDEFLLNLEELNRNLNGSFEKIIVLSRAVEAEIAQWLEADQYFGATGAEGMADGSIGTAINGSFWDLKNTFIDPISKEKKFTINELWNFMEKTEAGRQLLELAKDHNVRFQLPNGTVVGEGTGDIIEIVVGDTEQENYLGIYSNGKITLKKEYFEHAYKHPDELANTLAHEMQHSVDDGMNLIERGRVEDIRARKDNLEDIESYLNNCINSRIATEIRAHARGFEVDRSVNFGEGIVVDDGTHTVREKKFIMETRDYEEVYEEQYRTLLNESLDDAYEYDIDIWLDSKGNVQCKVIPMVVDRGNYA